MPSYSFTVEVGGMEPAIQPYADAIYRSGCDDALVAIVEGHVMVDFDREAATYDGAVGSALHDLERAGMRIVAVRPIEE